MYLRQRRSISRLASGADRIAAAERQAVDALVRASDGSGHDTTGPQQARSVEQALSLAQAACHAVSIPDEVARSAAESLDHSGRRRARGKAVLQALSALNAYALDGSRGGDFKQWCASGRGSSQTSYSAERIAMDESRSLRRNKRHMRARSFPVDSVLRLDGRLEMTSHIRIDQGETSPRLYFYDDTRGTTGKIHVGYIGPHLPTTSDPT